MDYRETLERAVIYIEEHLGEDITVEDVARFVGYSYYHLTRQFNAVLGEGEHKGSLESIMATFQYIWGTWMLNTKEELDARQDFECYDERFLGYRNPDSEVDIYIPVR